MSILVGVSLKLHLGSVNEFQPLKAQGWLVHDIAPYTLKNPLGTMHYPIPLTGIDTRTVQVSFRKFL